MCSTNLTICFITGLSRCCSVKVSISKWLSKWVSQSARRVRNETHVWHYFRARVGIIGSLAFAQVSAMFRAVSLHVLSDIRRLVLRAISNVFPVVSPKRR